MDYLTHGRIRWSFPLSFGYFSLLNQSKHKDAIHYLLHFSLSHAELSYFLPLDMKSFPRVNFSLERHYYLKCSCRKEQRLTPLGHRTRLILELKNPRTYLTTVGYVSMVRVWMGDHAAFMAVNASIAAALMR